MIEPYWQSDDGRYTVYCADCLTVLPQLTGIDAVVTDPPYGCGWKHGSNGTNSISSTGKHCSDTVIGDDKPFDPSPFLVCAEVWMTGAQYYYDRLPAGGTFHCWDKRGDYKPLDHSDADMIWSRRGGACRTFHCVWRGICRHVENQQKMVHPTQKPVALMEWILMQARLSADALVADPYMGSGTTGVACVKTGRRFVGIEIDQGYCDIAVKRIQDALTQLPLMEAAG